MRGKSIKSLKPQSKMGGYLRIRERVARNNIGRRKVVQDHVHAGDTSRSHVFILTFQRDAFASFRSNLQQLRARAACRVVCGGAGFGSLRGNPYDL